LNSSEAFCNTLDVVPNAADSQSQCLDVSMTPAIKQILPTEPLDQDQTLNIISITLDEPTCGTQGIGLEANELIYGVSPGSIGTASGGGVNAPLVATGGVVGVKQTCTDDGCQLVSLDRLKINVANMTIAGAQLANVVITNTASAPITQLLNPDNPGPGVAANSLTLFVEGDLNGVRVSSVVKNSAGLRLTATSTGFNLVGGLSITNVGATGHALPITVAANVSGTPATGQALACASESGLQRLFGFEDGLSWSSSHATLSQVTSPVTQGCGALGINGQGYIPITSSRFGTQGLSVTSALSVDLFIPGNQPNQNWLGALQMYLTCPSGNAFNEYIGQVDLTGKPQNHYSTLRYPIPSVVRSTLLQPLSDCFFGFALNVNQTGHTWILDNLRFTQ